MKKNIKFRRTPSAAHKVKALRVLFLSGFFLFCAFPVFAQTGQNVRRGGGKDKMIEKALIEYRRGNTPNALDLIYRVLEKYPKNVRAIDLYGQIKNGGAEVLLREGSVFQTRGKRYSA